MHILTLYMEKLPISVIILTYNEEVNLERALLSVRHWVHDIVVVDSGSTDKTVEIAKHFDARVFEHEFKHQADQFNWALENTSPTGDWILRLDADEVMMEELWHEIAEKLPKVSSETNGFLMKRRVYFMGRWIKHGGYYPAWMLRLFRKGHGRSEDRSMDEHIVLSSGRAERLEHDFIDDNHKDLASWIAKHNDFSTREAQERLCEAFSLTSNLSPITSLTGQAARKRWIKNNLYSRLPLFFRAHWYFVYRYIFRLGFLDGREGLIFHFLQGFWHQFTIDGKIYEARRKK